MYSQNLAKKGNLHEDLHSFLRLSIALIVNYLTERIMFAINFVEKNETHFMLNRPRS
jgi:hypothetical protein